MITHSKSASNRTRDCYLSHDVALFSVPNIAVPDIRRQVKNVVEAWRAIIKYLEAVGRAGAKFGAPLFVQFKKGDKATEQSLAGELPIGASF